MKQNQMDYYISKMEMALEKLREAKDLELEAIKMFNEIKMDNMHKKSLQDSLAAIQDKTPGIKPEMSKEEYYDLEEWRPTMATINYNGMELEEFNPDKSVSFNPPIKCVGWNNKDVKIEFELSAALSKDIWIHRFIGKSKDGNPAAFMHCALLPDHPKPRRVTNRELSRWLAQGNGECLGSQDDSDTAWNYPMESSNAPLREGAKVRKWEDTEWHEPTVDYLFGGD